MSRSLLDALCEAADRRAWQYAIEGSPDDVLALSDEMFVERVLEAVREALYVHVAPSTNFSTYPTGVITWAAALDVLAVRAADREGAGQ